MFYKTRDESDEIARAFGVSAAEMKRLAALRTRMQDSLVVHVEKSGVEFLELARCMTFWLGTHGSALLLVTEFGIWPGSEDMNLYYRLRASYGDSRELRDAPGHYFLAHERVDLVTFLALVLRFGWGGHLIAGVLCAYVSHDGWIRIRSSDPEVEPTRAKVLKDLDELSLKYEVE